MCYFCHAQPFEITHAENIKSPLEQHSCRNAKVVEAFSDAGCSLSTQRRPSIHQPLVDVLRIAPAAQPTPTSRDFVPWRFLDAGRQSAWMVSSSRRPKTLYERELVKAFLHGAYQAPIGGHILLFERLQSPHPSVPTRNLSKPSRAGPVKNGRRADRPTRRLISRPLLDWPEHDGRLGRDGIALAARRACPQEIGWPRLPRAPDGYQTALDFRDSPRRVERVQQVRRRCPWARAMIASPYIRQLRYGLPLCCMHGRSREKDGAHLHNGRLARPNLRWFLPATHPTRPTLH